MKQVPPEHLFEVKLMLDQDRNGELYFINIKLKFFSFMVKNKNK
jgi:hypothetical protein